MNEFLCSCYDSYIGETNRELLVWLKELQNASSNICAHMHTCDWYKSDAQQFVDANKLILPNPQKARLFKLNLK